MTPSGVRVAGVNTIFSSVTVVSLTLSPPPLIWRRASPFDETRPARTNAASTPRLAHFRARDFDRRQVFRKRALLEGAPRRIGGGVGRGAAMHQRGRFGGQHLLRLVHLGAVQRRKPADLVERQHGEQLEEARHVAVLGVAPVLPVVVRAHEVGVEPHRAGRGLAHLGARARGDQRRGQREQLHVRHAPAEVDAADDVAPLVGAAHLQHAAGALVQFDEVVGLQDHVVEFEERQLLLAIEPHLHRVEAQHAVDREVPADVAQEIDVVERIEPVGVVGHDGIAARSLELQELREDRADALRDSR